MLKLKRLSLPCYNRQALLKFKRLTFSSSLVKASGKAQLWCSTVDAEAPTWAAVSGEDAGDGAGERAEVRGELEAVEVERGGAPQVAPPGGQDRGAPGFLGGEERDDVLEDGVG